VDVAVGIGEMDERLLRRESPRGDHRQLVGTRPENGGDRQRPPSVFQRHWCGLLARMPGSEGKIASIAI
jgi:hypothetical protein